MDVGWGRILLFQLSVQGFLFIEGETSGGVMVLMIVCIEDDNIMTLNYITSSFFSSHGLAARFATTTRPP